MREKKRQLSKRYTGYPIYRLFKMIYRLCHILPVSYRQLDDILLESVKKQYIVQPSYIGQPIYRSPYKHHLKQDCCNVTCHFFVLISSLKQVSACKDTSYVNVSREAVAQRCSVKKVVLANFVKSTGKQLCQSLFIKATLLKKGLWHSCFPVNFAKFLRTVFLTEHLWWVLLLVIFTNDESTRYTSPFFPVSHNNMLGKSGDVLQKRCS